MLSGWRAALRCDLGQALRVLAVACAALADLPFSADDQGLAFFPDCVLKELDSA